MTESVHYVPEHPSTMSPVYTKWWHTLDSPKHLVRVAANTAAMVQQTDSGVALQFAPESPFAGVILLLKGIPALQLAFGFNRPLRIGSG